ncbi:MAG: cobalt-precorrin-6A reductase [Hormoscilla sp. GM102CHS1]|nr:cobalt-precorrin-6A reductase [Hormoscilla sp. GM102CHS1]
MSDTTQSSRGRIWLIGGTTESAQLAQKLGQSQIFCTVTVTTTAARSLYPLSPYLRVEVRQIDATRIGHFLEREQILGILDATHPYAVAISQMAIAAAAQHHLPYLRYERPELKNHPREEIACLESFEQLLAGDYLKGQKVLLTVGYKPLPLFCSWHEKATLFARILPSVTSLETALGAGFTSDRIITIRPPVPANLERELWRHWQISLVVTKASGKAGGEDIKHTVADELGIPLIAIARPRVNYPQQTSDLSVAIAFCLANC